MDSADQVFTVYMYQGWSGSIGYGNAPDLIDGVEKTVALLLDHLVKFEGVITNYTASHRHIHHNLRRVHIARTARRGGRLARQHRSRACDCHDEAAAPPLDGGGHSTVLVLLQDPVQADQDILPKARSKLRGIKHKGKLRLIM